MANQALHDQITALQVVVSALAISQKDNEDFLDSLANHLTSEGFAALALSEQNSIRASVELLIARQLPA